MGIKKEEFDLGLRHFGLGIEIVGGKARERNSNWRTFLKTRVG